MRGTLGDCPHRNTAEKNNRHRITAKKRGEAPTFCPSINLVQISIWLGIEDLGAGLVISREWDWPQDSIFHLLYFANSIFSQADRKMPSSQKQKNSCKSFLNINVYSFDCCIIKYWERYSHCQGKSSCNLQENGLTKFVCNSKSIFPIYAIS